MQGDKKNTYGGMLYGSISSTRGDYRDTQDTFYNNSATIGYKQSLFRKFGEEYNTISLFSAKEKVKLIKLQNKEQKANIILKAVGYYYESVRNSAMIKIQEKSLIRAENNYNIAKAKQKSGLVSKIDVYRAKLSFLDQSKNLNNSIKQYKNSIENLYYYLNQDVEKNISIDQTSTIKIIKNTIEDKDNSEILFGNLAWNEILLSEKIIKKQLYNANKDFLPDIELDMKYKKYSLKKKFNEASGFDQDDWSITLNSNYGFNTTEQNINKQKIIILNSKIQRDKRSLKRYIFKEINELKNDYQNILENLEIYKLKKIEAKDSLTVAKIRYERGLSSNLDILDAESAYSSSQIEYVSEILRYNLALLKYAKAVNELDIDYIRRAIQ